jgi:hypothetical protein
MTPGSAPSNSGFVYVAADAFPRPSPFSEKVVARIPSAALFDGRHAFRAAAIISPHLADLSRHTAAALASHSSDGGADGGADGLASGRLFGGFGLSFCAVHWPAGLRAYPRAHFAHCIFPDSLSNANDAHDGSCLSAVPFGTQFHRRVREYSNPGLHFVHLGVLTANPFLTSLKYSAHARSFALDWVGTFSVTHIPFWSLDPGLHFVHL